MGWIYALNPFVGVFVYEVKEPAGKPPKGRRTMQVIGVDRCSNTGHELVYRTDEVYATKAEAQKAMDAFFVERRKYEEEKKAARKAGRKAYSKRLHYPTQKRQWSKEKYFIEARKKNLAACEFDHPANFPRTGSKTLTTDKSKVTCLICLRWLRRI